MSPVQLRESLVETEIRGSICVSVTERRYKIDRSGRLRQLKPKGTGDCQNTHLSFFDAADTSSFTLSGQRENIEGVEVGCGKQIESRGRHQRGCLPAKPASTSCHHSTSSPSSAFQQRSTTRPSRIEGKSIR